MTFFAEKNGLLFFGSETVLFQSRCKDIALFLICKSFRTFFTEIFYHTSKPLYTSLVYALKRIKNI